MAINMPQYGSVTTKGAGSIGGPAGGDALIGLAAKYGGGSTGNVMLGGLMGGIGGLMQRADQQMQAEAERAKAIDAMNLDLKKKAAINAMQRGEDEFGARLDVKKHESYAEINDRFQTAAEQRKEGRNSPMPAGIAQSYAQYRGDIQDVAAKYGLPSNLFAGVLIQESGLDPNAVGDGGHSLGLGQLNTRNGAGRDLMNDLGITKEQIANASPQQQMEWSARYLSDQAKHFTDQNGNVDWTKALDAYNKGIGGVGRKDTGDPNYVANVMRKATWVTNYENGNVSNAPSGKPQKPGMNDLLVGANITSDPKTANDWYMSAIKNPANRDYLTEQVDILDGMMTSDVKALVNLSTAQKAALIVQEGSPQKALEKLQPRIERVSREKASLANKGNLPNLERSPASINAMPKQTRDQAQIRQNYEIMKTNAYVEAKKRAAAGQAGYAGLTDVALKAKSDAAVDRAFRAKGLL